MHLLYFTLSLPGLGANTPMLTQLPSNILCESMIFLLREVVRHMNQQSHRIIVKDYEDNIFLDGTDINYIMGYLPLFINSQAIFISKCRKYFCIVS